jgi:hypothetical protein
MFGSEILDVAIGLVFVYVLLSLLCLTIAEFLARVFAMRAGTLEQAIRNILSEQGSSMVEEFYAHPLIKKLSLENAGHGIGQGNGKPSYISASAFSLVLLDIITAHQGATQTPQTVEDVKTAVAGSGYQELSKLLVTIMGYNATDLQEARKNIETWFDEYMGRVEGWYRRKTQVIVLVLGLVLAALLNADTLTLAETLSSDAALRNAIVDAAVKEITVTPPGQSPDDGTVAEVVRLWEKLDQLNLPLGWMAADPAIQDLREIPVAPMDWADKVLGLLITGLLVSLGAPFWFDLLGKLVNIRAVGRPPGETGNEAGATKLLLPGDGTFVTLPTQPGAPRPHPQPPVQPPVETQLAQLAAESVAYVRQLQAKGQLRLPEVDVATAWVVTKVHDLGLGSEVSDSQIAAAVRSALA